VEKPELVASWSLNILDREGKVVRAMTGSGAPARRLLWRGESEGAAIAPGGIYQYQLQVSYLDGSSVTTGRELFGVNRQEAVLLTLAGGAFVFDTWDLTAEAKRLLKGAARVLKAHPEEKVIVEGHTDGIGTERYNMELSRKRCESAAQYLVREEGVPASRLVKRWYGKSRPIADNGSAAGRTLNRRVELKGNFQEKVPVSPDDRYRTAAYVVINDRRVPVDNYGRFQTTVSADTSSLKVEMGDSLGRQLATTVPAPMLGLAEPAGIQRAVFGSSSGWLTVDAGGAARCLLSGKVEPGSALEIDGAAVKVSEAGAFALELPVALGEQVVGMVIRHASGCSKLINLRVQSKSQLLEAGALP
jgi:outer membrane protein OmpA-like peptidoglycan-associated protein